LTASLCASSNLKPCLHLVYDSSCTSCADAFAPCHVLAVTSSASLSRCAPAPHSLSPTPRHVLPPRCHTHGSFRFVSCCPRSLYSSLNPSIFLVIYCL
jgi:hypothetical protein